MDGKVGCETSEWVIEHRETLKRIACELAKCYYGKRIKFEINIDKDSDSCKINVIDLE